MNWKNAGYNMQRITEKQLQAVVDRINRITNSPMESYTKDESGHYRSNIGNFHLSFAYGGVNLCRMLNDGGAVENVLGCGHITKRDLYERMHAFIAGIEVNQKG